MIASWEDSTMEASSDRVASTFTPTRLFAMTHPP
jgi:hypothetical protein